MTKKFLSLTEIYEDRYYTPKQIMAFLRKRNYRKIGLLDVKELIRSGEIRSVYAKISEKSNKYIFVKGIDLKLFIYENKTKLDKWKKYK